VFKIGIAVAGMKCLPGTLVSEKFGPWDVAWGMERGLASGE